MDVFWPSEDIILRNIEEFDSVKSAVGINCPCACMLVSSENVYD